MPVTSPAANGNTSDGAQMAHNTSMWGRKKPCILLVEDDKTCARIGAKFLQQLECSVDVAVCVSIFASLLFLGLPPRRLD